MAKTSDGQDLFWVASAAPHVRHQTKKCATQIAGLRGGEVTRIAGPEVSRHRDEHGDGSARNRCSLCWGSRWNDVT
jgi:hypothetical protein